MGIVSCTEGDVNDPLEFQFGMNELHLWSVGRCDKVNGGVTNQVSVVSPTNVHCGVQGKRNWNEPIPGFP